MNQCQNCGSGFEGNFCPVCGTPYQAQDQSRSQAEQPSMEARACPVCGMSYTGNFCPRGCQNPGVSVPVKKGLKGWQIALIIGGCLLIPALIFLSFIAMNIRSYSRQVEVPEYDWYEPYVQPTVPYSNGELVTTLYSDQEITQHGCTITLRRVDIYENKTKAYIRIENKSQERFVLLEYLSHIRQQEKYIDDSANDPLDACPQASLEPGESTSGVLTFSPVDADEPFYIELEGSNISDDAFETYQFEVLPE